MNLSDLVRKIKYLDLVHGRDFEIKGVSNNSKNIGEDYIFVAVKGSIFDGHRYIKDAINNGAKAVVHTDDIEPIDGISYIKVADSRKILADVSNIITEYPSEKVNVIGVTGTNGKTTTSKLITYLIERVFGPCANIGTDGAEVLDENYETSNTTPDITEINRVLAKCIEKNVDYLTLEASSHGLYQKRLEGVHFKVGVFTNLSTEHLDYHKTMENYFDAKMILMENSDIVIANIDDDWGEEVVKRFDHTLTFGKSEKAHVRATDILKDGKKTSFKIDGVDFKINSIADFELYNHLAAITTLKVLGASLTDLSDVIGDFKGVGSRFEYIENDKDLNVIVDFAHTPRAFEEIFKSLPEDRRKIAVFGIQGDRNEDFRRLIGKIISDYWVYAIITTDDPKFDTFENISKDIVSGMSENYGDYSLVKDRTDAIKAALNMAEDGDYVLFMGKGEENFIKIHGNEKTPWDEKETIRKALRDL
ncbi:UDP-N-acetylmuramoyl-L-alanyl-D-glutamate--2,6-diaminopimelate ligase [uncultured Anaerococcus sp.]|uniref:UDP-N-acetylmuramoyl-L-alanyl-D-glutamate--2, 6-diaminopimelate ligase n=1 Tax=uncultured Anaerococcus sp. TaxID=293428 RepID=UPI0025E9263E|nr:UDP-N-acetylmuramoyl-L-alanyl-D-glutamate--2,6-diaminopimelate ligase [uncultured Anaerococcus sp.]